MDFKRNNLDQALSPYLQQHKYNPIHWQEWNKEVLEHAQKENKPLFISIGYSTCHWCHIMAGEAFSNQDVAQYVNEHFVAIKIDREQRPDIDQYMMDFIIATQGSGGWPLNVFLTPELKPYLAITYAAVTSRFGGLPFLDVAKIAQDLYKKEGEKLNVYDPGKISLEKVEAQQLLKEIADNFDSTYGGFGYSMKFPPHTTLLFLLHYYDYRREDYVKDMLEKTLDMMAMKGLHDHVQGGFYRYCTDKAWTIPHFEKMLYDQAMLLWVYSTAYKVLKKEAYKVIAEKIIKCLDETFQKDNVYYAGHDADTNHEEGQMYLWDKDEFLASMDVPQWSEFSKLYEVEDVNFNDKFHLIKKDLLFLPEVEEALLHIRNGREQPFTDKKIITSWNCLTGVALIHAYRYLGKEAYLEKAKKLFDTLVEKHYSNGKVVHSSLNNHVQGDEFLEDYASMLLLVSYLHEETGGYREIVEELYSKIHEFHQGSWYESKGNDFHKVEAKLYDHPVPSSASLAEFALFRSNLLLGKDYMPESYRKALDHDFFNVVAFMKQGNLHHIHSPEKLVWENLPLSSIQTRGAIIQDCYRGMCKAFESAEKLVEAMKS